MNYRLCLSILLIVVTVTFVTAQEPSKTEVKQQAEQQLQQMSPDQIDAKIKELGMTRTEADAKAKEFGIDLNTYLNRTSGLKTQPVLSSEQKPGQTTAQDKKEDAAITAEEQKEIKEEIDSQKKGFNPPDADEARIYGLSFFRSGGSNFEPSPSIADKEYVVGTGDVLKISLWGQLQSTEEVTVDREGRITLSNVGAVLVSGYTIEAAKKRITIALSRSYSGLVGKPPSIFLDLSLSKLRPVRVFIMGEVQNPGGYFVSNFANVFNSLFVVGGPKPSGSMREVRVIRNNKVIAKVDLYDYLFGAVKTADVRVNDNDIIYVPLRGKRVSIQGEVLRPSSYELLPGENLKKLIEFSGGLHSNVYKDRIQLDRVIPLSERVKGGEERRLYDIDFADIASGKKDYTLEDGDVITLFPIVDLTGNYVIVQGAVKRPGTFQIDKIKTVKDLIAAADGLLPTVYMQRAELLRQYPNGKLEVMTLDLGKVMSNDPKHNLKLERFDRVSIFSLYDINGPKTISINGHVKFPGTYPYADSMTVGRLLRSLGGLEDSLYRAVTFLDRGDIFRLNDDLISRRRIEFNLATILENRSPDIAIMPGDEVRIYGLNEITFLSPTVEIYGSVKNPGTFRLVQGMTLTDLVLLAGGYTEDAYAVTAEIARVTRAANQGDSIVSIIFTELPDLFDTTQSAISVLSSDAGSYRLIDRDKIFIRDNPDYHVQQLVAISGEVKFPGRYALTRSRERLSDIVQRAGGLTRDGYARGGRLMRGEDRMRLNIEEAIENPLGNYDAILRPGDEIVIPRFPNTVVVAGEVNNPGQYAFVDGKSRDFYLDMAGGVTDSADFVLVSYPEGYIERTGLGWFASNPSIPDGSTIVVAKIKPDPPEPPSVGGESFFSSWKDVMAVLASTLTVLVLATRLN